MEIEIKKSYYDNGNLKSEHSYLNGVRHGLQKIYRSQGGLWLKYYVTNDQQSGVGQEYHLFGNIKLIETMKKSLFNGLRFGFNYGN